jgi:hypothetical protein
MNDEKYKEVYYHKYCMKCKHANLKDTDEPCAECLDIPINLHSHKPVNFEKKK